MAKIYRKSQGMPINVVIIAVLALIVLVVLAAIFTGRVRIFSQSLESCAAKQGQCTEKPGDNCKSNEATIANTDCDKEKKKCCVQVLST